MQHPVLDEIEKAGIELTEVGDECHIEGFYHQNVKLVIDASGALDAIFSRGGSLPVHSFDQLVHYNFREWQVARRVSIEFILPHHHWRDHYKRLGLEW